MSVVAPRISSVLHGPHLGELDDSELPQSASNQIMMANNDSRLLLFFQKKSIPHKRAIHGWKKSKYALKNERPKTQKMMVTGR